MKKLVSKLFALATAGLLVACNVGGASQSPSAAPGASPSEGAACEVEQADDVLARSIDCSCYDPATKKTTPIRCAGEKCNCCPAGQTNGPELG
jgi:hypothetical protein